MKSGSMKVTRQREIYKPRPVLSRFTFSLTTTRFTAINPTMRSFKEAQSHIGSLFSWMMNSILEVFFRAPDLYR
jgi:hypothetical protein